MSYRTGVSMYGKRPVMSEKAPGEYQRATTKHSAAIPRANEMDQRHGHSHRAIGFGKKPNRVLISTAMEEMQTAKKNHATGYESGRRAFGHSARAPLSPRSPNNAAALPTRSLLLAAFACAIKSLICIVAPRFRQHQYDVGATACKWRCL